MRFLLWIHSNAQNKIQIEFQFRLDGFGQKVKFLLKRNSWKCVHQKSGSSSFIMQAEKISTIATSKK